MSSVRSVSASIISCSVGSHRTWVLVTPLGVRPRAKLPKQSYWVMVSPMPASNCGCVATTW